jgi:hypothetical protein
MHYYLINNYQIKLTTNLLTNNQIKIKFNKNKLIILFNPSDIDISKLLTKNYITYKPLYNTLNYNITKINK